jgi:hypothetical protein
MKRLNCLDRLASNQRGVQFNAVNDLGRGDSVDKAALGKFTFCDSSVLGPVRVNHQVVTVLHDTTLNIGQSLGSKVLRALTNESIPEYCWTSLSLNGIVFQELPADETRNVQSIDSREMSFSRMRLVSRPVGCGPRRSVR